MEHVITLGDLVLWSAVGIGILIVIGTVIGVLSIFANAFKD